MTDDELRQHYIQNPETPYVYETEAFATVFDARG
jgi:hypothetical protein